ncbi:MAG: DEAD/DEAH box helicase [Myxococcales bacterium]|nr:DEAD/DEAH box helicase [Myxococcales bacterium]
MRLVFDRGTLSFPGDWPVELLRTVPGALWDARSGLFRAPPWRYAEVVGALARRGVAFDDAVDPARTRLDAFDEVPLRPYQQAALAAWEAAGRRGIAVLPTGAGKTRLAIAAIAATRAPALVLVPTRVLLHQWCGEIARFHAAPVGRWGDGARERAPVTVMTFESAYRHMGELGGSFGLLVVDEVHHFGVGPRDEALEMAVAPWRLGLTDTLPADESARAALAALVGRPVVELAVHDLAGGYLAAFELVELRLGLDADERQRHEAEVARFRPFFRAFRRIAGDASWKDFLAAARQSEEGRQAVAAWRRAKKLVGYTRAKEVAVRALLARHAGARVLVFTAENDAAYAIAQRELVMPLTCDIGRAEREAALARFRTGELDVLVSARVLNEGIDVPDADVAIIVGGTQGAREHVQRIGRLLRPAPGKRAVVYELVTEGTGEVAQAERRRDGLGRSIAVPA